MGTMSERIELPESARLADELASVLARHERAAAAAAVLASIKLLRCIGEREAADKLERASPSVLARAQR